MPGFLNYFPFPQISRLYSASSHMQNSTPEGLHPTCKSVNVGGHLCAASHSFIRKIFNSTLSSTENILLQMKASSTFIT